MMGTAGLMLIVSAANQPLQLIVFGSILDSFNSADRDEVRGRINFFALCYTVLGVQQIITVSLQLSLLSASAARQVQRMRTALYTSLVHRPLTFYDGKDSGALAASVLESTSTIAAGIGDELSEAIQRVLAFLVGIAAALYYAWQLALVVSVAIPLIMVVV